MESEPTGKHTRHRFRRRLPRLLPHLHRHRTGAGSRTRASSASHAPSRTDTFLGERYHRIARRRGKRRAMVAIGNSVLTIIWNLLSDPAARYHDLGPDFYHSRHGRQRRERDLIRRLEQLTGKTVTLQPGPGEQPAA